MTNQDSLSEMDREYISRIYRHRGERCIRRIVDEVVIWHSERVASLSGNDRVLYVGNHQTFEDNILPHYALLSIGAPFPISVAKESMNRQPFKGFMRFMLGFDIERFGILWLDNKKVGKDAFRDFRDGAGKIIRAGHSMLVYPEGHRYNNPDGLPSPFKRTPFAVVMGEEELWSRREAINHPDKIVCFGCDYDRIPESEVRTVYNLFGKPAGDVCAPLRWNFMRNRGAVRINFGEPMGFIDAAGEGDIGKCSRRLAERCYEGVVSLLEETRRNGE